MTKPSVFLLIITLLTHSFCQAQRNNLFFDLTGGVGRLTPHHPELKPFGGSVAFFDFKVGYKTLGKKEWQRVYHYPEIGIGLSHNYLTSRILGNPTALYSFMNLPLSPSSKIKINLGMNLGLAWGFNHWTEQNQENIAIGSDFTAYACININTSLRINESLEFLLSAGGYHYSNGNLNKPNKGINLLGAETGFRYLLSKSHAELNTEPISPVIKSSSVMIFGAFGTKKEASFSSQYPTGSISVGYYYTVNHKSRMNAGVDLFYDEGALYYTQKVNKLNNVLAVGIFGGHELTFAKFSIVSQIGIYLKNPNPNDPFYYERLGLRYRISKRVIPSLTIKAHEFKIDFIEWGIGYVLSRR